MKKLAAILLSAILLFNWVGYRLLFGYMESTSTQYLSSQLDNRQYDESSLITIKIPVENLPYYTNSPIFDRVKGSISIGGMTYEYVEKRIFNDSIEMRCIPNAQATHLTNARDAFFQMVADLQHTSSSGKPAPAKPAISLKNILPDCVQTDGLQAFEPVFTENPILYSDFSCNTSTGVFSNPDMPPDPSCLLVM